MHYSLNLDFEGYLIIVLALLSGLLLLDLGNLDLPWLQNCLLISSEYCLVVKRRLREAFTFSVAALISQTSEIR